VRTAERLRRLGFASVDQLTGVGMGSLRWLTAGLSPLRVDHGWLSLLGHARLLRPGTPIEVRLTTSGDAVWSGLPREAPERFRLPSGLLEEIWPLLLTQNEYGSRHRQTPAQRAPYVSGSGAWTFRTSVATCSPSSRRIELPLANAHAPPL
jgi:hypothetical protein